MTNERTRSLGRLVCPQVDGADAIGDFSRDPMLDPVIDLRKGLDLQITHPGVQSLDVPGQQGRIGEAP